jgi:hypothetical protein
LFAVKTLRAPALNDSYFHGPLPTGLLSISFGLAPSGSTEYP